LLVTIKLKHEKDGWAVEDMAEELEELAVTCGASILDNIACAIEKPTPNFFIGRGKAQEISFLAQELEADTVIFSRDLSGTQQRNLEEVIGKKTIDRTQLILDIFARHARSPVGKMQVELAQLEYLLPRLIGKGLILSRTGGGIGTSGPGEQRLEIDRRRIRKKIDKLRSDLDSYSTHRDTARKKRKDNALPQVAFVGYTNAGKSTLLNALTGSSQVVADSLFTTLDTLSKNLELPNGEHVILCDTVGFLDNLPHHLVESFKATLEEVTQADLLVHVLDASHPKIHEHSRSVFEVLKQLGADEKPVITALNKIDAVEDKGAVEILRNGFQEAVLISAKTKENLDLLLGRIEQSFAARMRYLEIVIPHSHIGLIDLFYREGKVRQIDYLQQGIEVKLTLPVILAEKLLSDKKVKLL